MYIGDYHSSPFFAPFVRRGALRRGDSKQSYNNSSKGVTYQHIWAETDDLFNFVRFVLPFEHNFYKALVSTFFLSSLLFAQLVAIISPHPKPPPSLPSLRSPRSHSRYVRIDTYRIYCMIQIDYRDNPIINPPPPPLPPKPRILAVAF